MTAPVLPVIVAAVFLAAAFVLGLVVGLTVRRRYVLLPLLMGEQQPKGSVISMDVPHINLGDSSKQPFSVGSGVDAAGNAAPIEDLIVSSSDESLMTIEDLGGGSYFAVAVGLLGTGVQVNAKADAHIGDGVEAISGTLFTLDVTAEQAVGFAPVTFGQQVPK